MDCSMVEPTCIATIALIFFVLCVAHLAVEFLL